MPYIIYASAPSADGSIQAVGATEDDAWRDWHEATGESDRGGLSAIRATRELVDTLDEKADPTIPWTISRRGPAGERTAVLDHERM